MIVLLALLVVSVFLLCTYLKHKHSYWRRRQIVHDEPDFPQGNVKEWRQHKHLKDIVDSVYRKYKGAGPFAGFYFMFAPAVIALDLDFIRNVLIRDFSTFADRGLFHNEIDDPLSGNIFTMDGLKWRSLRTRFTPTFTSGKMKLMFPTVLSIGKMLSVTIGEKIQHTADVIEISALMKCFTADVIASCAFGLECSSLRNPKDEFVQFGERVGTERAHCKFVVRLMESYPRMARMLRMRKFTPDCEHFYIQIVKETENYRLENNVKRNDFMDTLLQMKHCAVDPLSLNEIAAQAFVFLIAGFETSSTTMAFALYELAKNPSIQDKVRHEIVNVLQRHDNEFTYEYTSEMKYLNQVVSETLRCYPVISTLSRQSKSKYTPLDPKYYIDKDTQVIIPVYAIHHDPELYPEPYRFDPERFTDEQIQKRHPCAWLPFGVGPRNCIGMRFGRMQTIIGLALLIQKFEFSVSPLTQDTVEFNPKRTALTPLGGIHLNVQVID